MLTRFYVTWLVLAAPLYLSPKFGFTFPSGEEPKWLFFLALALVDALVRSPFLVSAR